MKRTRPTSSLAAVALFAIIGGVLGFFATGSLYGATGPPLESKRVVAPRWQRQRNELAIYSTVICGVTVGSFCGAIAGAALDRRMRMEH